MAGTASRRGQMKQIFDRYASAGGPAGRHSTQQYIKSQLASRPRGRHRQKRLSKRLTGCLASFAPAGGVWQSGAGKEKSSYDDGHAWKLGNRSASRIIAQSGLGAGQGFPAFCGTARTRLLPRRSLHRPICRSIGRDWMNLKALNTGDPGSGGNGRRHHGSLQCVCAGARRLKAVSCFLAHRGILSLSFTCI